MCCTISTGTPISPGMAGRIRASAVGPPVDTPIRTISGFAGFARRCMRPVIWSRCSAGAPHPGKPEAGLQGTPVSPAGALRFDLSGARSEVTLGGLRGAARPRKMVRISKRRATARTRGPNSRSRASRPFSGLTVSGLVMKSKAPFSRARMVRSPPRRESALTTSTSGSGSPLRRSASSTARPSISGISISRVRRSGFSSRTFCRANLPLIALPTTSTPGSDASTSPSSRRKRVASSATRTFTLIPCLLEQNQSEYVPSLKGRGFSRADGCRASSGL